MAGASRERSEQDWETQRRTAKRHHLPHMLLERREEFVEEGAEALGGGGRGLDHLGVRQRHLGDACGQVGAQRDAQHLCAHVAGCGGLGHGGHAHHRPAQGLGHADLGGGLEHWPVEPEVHALLQLLPQPGRGRVGLGAQLGCVHVGHVGEAGAEAFVVGAGQHADPGQVHMVGDHGQVAGGHTLAAAAGGVGEHHHPASRGDRGPHRERDGLRVVALVGVGPPRQQQHPVVAHLRRVGRAGVADRGGDRESGQVPVRHRHLVADPVRIRPQPRPQHHNHVMALAPGPLSQHRRGPLQPLIQLAHYALLLRGRGRPAGASSRSQLRPCTALQPSITWGLPGGAG